jgi:putative proteasome-type protease
MSYCLGIKTRDGLVMASDSRTSAGDQVNLTRKMHLFELPNERVFCILTTGSLSLSQSVVTLLRFDFDAGKGLATAQTMYDAARVVGEKVRFVSDLDRAPLERDGFSFNVHMLLGGQIAGQSTELYLVYPQGNPIRATADTPYIQIGESKYGRPILDRGVTYENTSLEAATKYALISLDSTIRSNSSVGLPIDLLLYPNDSLNFGRQRRFKAGDPELQAIHQQWEQSLRRAVQELPAINVDPLPSDSS